MRPTLLPTAAAAVIAAALATSAGAQSARDAIVNEAVRAAEQAQQADKDKVDRMSREATQATQAAPTGAEAVGSTATPAQTLARATQADPNRKLSLRHLIDRPLLDTAGRPVGEVKDVLIDASGTGALVLVEAAGQVRGVNAARLQTGGDDGAGYRVDLDAAGIASLPSFRPDGDAWRMAE